MQIGFELMLTLQYKKNILNSKGLMNFLTYFERMQKSNTQIQNTTNIMLVKITSIMKILTSQN